MIKKFVRNSIIKDYEDAIEDYLVSFESKSREKQADYFVFSTRTRAGLQLEGAITWPDGSKNLEANLHIHPGVAAETLPIIIEQLQSIVDTFMHKGLQTEAWCMLIWAHTYRMLLFEEELKPQYDRLWDSIMATKDLWPEMIKHHYSLDKADTATDNLKETYVLVAEILKTVPPQYDKL